MDDLMHEINAALMETEVDEKAVLKKLGELTEEFQADEESYNEDAEWFEAGLDPEKVRQA